MVTHNSELAGKYSTRVVRMLDGRIDGDTNPPERDEIEREEKEELLNEEEKRTEKLPGMSFATGFCLSLMLACLTFKLILNSDCYYYDEETDSCKDPRDNEASLRYLYSNAVPIKITGIILPKEDSASAMLSTGGLSCIGYTYKLVEYLSESAEKSEAIQKQLQNPEKDIFTGLPFLSETAPAHKADAFKEYAAGLSDEEKAEAYIAIRSLTTEKQLSRIRGR